jgi:predicted nucleotidyltransferase
MIISNSTVDNVPELVDGLGTLLFHYYRGSYAYGTYIEGVSDKDEGAVYICDENMLYGLKDLYVEQASDKKSDKVAYELGRFIELLATANPTILEALFVPDRCVIYEHPLFRKLREERDKFLSKNTITTLLGYSKSQILKARGLKKKIVNPITERKTPLDFCWTFNDKQGTMRLSDWLEKRGLKQKYCGLNHMPNMEQMYGLYYDLVGHLHCEYKTVEELAEAMVDEQNGKTKKKPLHKLFEMFGSKGESWYNSLQDYFLFTCYKATPKGYHGIIKEDGTSNEVRLDSIVEGDKPLCYIHYNQNGYVSHCKEYKEYQEWIKKRNPIRYESNREANFDSKNMMHNIRLLTMAKELSEGKGFIVDRTEAGDVNLLLDIRNHKYEYDEILAMSERLKDEIENNLETCMLSDTASYDTLNEILVRYRNEFYK